MNGIYKRALHIAYVVCTLETCGFASDFLILLRYRNFLPC